MTPEELLRHILHRCEKEQCNASASDSKVECYKSTKANYTSKNESRDFFLALWTEQLAYRVTLSASLRNVLLYLLPSQWSGEPCGMGCLKEEAADDSDKNDLQYIKKNYPQQNFLITKEEGETPFFSVLRNLVALLQPKQPQLAMDLKEWMASLDRTLLSLRGFFLKLHSAFLSSFCEVDKQLTEARSNIPWKEMRQAYCSAVCDLCHLLDDQLVTIVSRTIVVQLNSACGCLWTRLFKKSKSQSPESVSEAVACLVAKRLDSIAAYVAATVAFASMYPSETQRIQLLDSSTAACIDNVRCSCCSYVAKLETVTTDEKELPCRGELSVDAPMNLKNNANNKPAFDMQAIDITSVPLDQAYSLIARPENDNLSSRVAAIAPLEDDTLLMVEHLLADQQKEAIKEGNSARDTSVARKLIPEGGNWPVKPSDGPQELSGNLATTAAAISSPKTLSSPQKDKSSLKESETFWTRLQHVLDLEDAAIQRIRARCKLDNESPYPGVFLVDLDVRNNDHATVSFVESLQRLIPSSPSAEMSARNTRLFKEACAGYAEELQNKSKELQSALPFLPTRTYGVLLGSLYAVLRADKQFQSLKQIYQQTCHLPGNSANKVSDQALLSNIETLIMKRIHFFSKSAASEDTSTELPTCGVADGVLESRRRWSQKRMSKDGPHNATVPAFGETEQSHHALMQYTQGRSGSSISVSSLQSCTKRTKRRSSIAEAFSEARRSISHIHMPIPPLETRIEEVYKLACRFYGVTVNSLLMRQLMQAKENFITTLDLSNIYIGLRGLRPVLALLTFNGNHLISLSLCNNNLENEEVAEISRTLEGPAGENLVYLDLSFNPITCSAFATLQKLSKQLPRLESLLLKATLLSPDTEQELQRLVASKSEQRCF